MTLYDLGKVVGEDGQQGQTGATGNGIASISKTGTSGKVDTYTITYTNGNTATFTVTNGDDATVTIQTSWGSTLSDTKVPSEKLVKNSLPTKLSDLTNDSDFIETSSTSGLIKNDGSIDTSTYLTEMKIGSTSGLPVKTGSNGALTTGSFGTSSGTLAEGNHTHSGYVSATKVTSWSSIVSDSNVPSEKLVKDTIDGLSIPTKISDLTNDSDFIETSSTSGLIKNDGTIDTTSYATSQTIVNYATTNLVAKSDIADNLTTDSSTKVLSAKQGKALADLIGQAIQYINL